MSGKRREETYARGYQVGLTICTVWPIVMYFLTPWIFQNLLVGTILLIISFAQYFLVAQNGR